MSAIRIGHRVERTGPKPVGEVLQLFGSGRPGDPVQALVHFDSGLAVIKVAELEHADEAQAAEAVASEEALHV